MEKDKQVVLSVHLHGRQMGKLLVHCALQPIRVLKSPQKAVKKSSLESERTRDARAVGEVGMSAGLAGFMSSRQQSRLEHNKREMLQQHARGIRMTAAAPNAARHVNRGYGAVPRIGSARWLGAVSPARIRKETSSEYSKNHYKSIQGKRRYEYHSKVIKTKFRAMSIKT